MSILQTSAELYSVGTSISSLSQLIIASVGAWTLINGVNLCLAEFLPHREISIKVPSSTLKCILYGGQVHDGWPVPSVTVAWILAERSLGGRGCKGQRAWFGGWELLFTRDFWTWHYSNTMFLMHYHGCGEITTRRVYFPGECTSSDDRFDPFGSTHLVSMQFEHMTGNSSGLCVSCVCVV